MISQIFESEKSARNRNRKGPSSVRPLLCSSIVSELFKQRKSKRDHCTLSDDNEEPRCRSDRKDKSEMQIKKAEFILVSVSMKNDLFAKQC